MASNKLNALFESSFSEVSLEKEKTEKEFVPTVNTETELQEENTEEKELDSLPSRVSGAPHLTKKRGRPKGAMKKATTTISKANSVDALFPMQERKFTTSICFDSDVLEWVDGLSKHYRTSRSEIVNTLVRYAWNDLEK